MVTRYDSFQTEGAVPNFYVCMSCGQDLSDWLMKAEEDDCCPYCGAELETRQLQGVRFEEKIKGAFAFFSLFSVIATPLMCLLTEQLLLALLLGPAIGALATGLLVVAVHRWNRRKNYDR